MKRAALHEVRSGSTTDSRNLPTPRPGLLHHLDGSANHVGGALLAFWAFRHALAPLYVELPDVFGGLERVNWSVGIKLFDMTL